MGTCTALLLHRAIVFDTQECLTDSLASEALLASSQSSSESVVRPCDLSDFVLMDAVTMWWLLVVLLLCFLLVCRFASSRCCVDESWLSVRVFTAMSISLGLVTMCLVSFFRRRRCDLSDHDCILFNLTCNSAEPILT